MPRKVMNLTGQRFGQLTAISQTDSDDKDGKIRWICHCDCGETVVVKTNYLRSGKKEKCGGCLHHKNHERHGRFGTTEYVSWASMIQRCTNPNHDAYPNYGGRGIRVCAHWRGGFLNFINDVGDRPEDCTIDRIDNDKGYTCGHCDQCLANGWKANCQWADRYQQANNRRDNRKIPFGDRLASIREVSNEIGVPYTTLHSRIRRGWAMEDVVSVKCKE